MIEAQSEDSHQAMHKFVACFEPFSHHGTPPAVRKKAWSKADPNGNGIVSLAELDKWIKKELWTK